MQPVFDAPDDKTTSKLSEKGEKEDHLQAGLQKQENAENGTDEKLLKDLDSESPGLAKSLLLNPLSSKETTRNGKGDLTAKVSISHGDSSPSAVSNLEAEKYSHLSQNKNELSFVNSKNSQNDDNLTMDDVRSVAVGMRKILSASNTQSSHRSQEDEVSNHNIDHIRNLIEKLDDEVIHRKRV